MNTIERESRILRERRLELGLSQTEVALNAGLQLVTCLLSILYTALSIKVKKTYLNEEVPSRIMSLS